MQTVMTILAAHFIGDYLLQQFPLFQLKRFNLAVLLLHTVIWSVVISLALLLLRRFAWWKFAFSLVAHTVVDCWKSRFNPYPAPLDIIITDQLLHMVQLYIVSQPIRSPVDRHCQK